MIGLTRRLASVAAMFLAGIVPAGWAEPQAEPTPTASSIAVTGVRSFLPVTYQADRQNWAIAEDNRGILYLGNSSGVLEFDGTRWRHIELPGKSGAYALGKTSDGRILVGGEGWVGWLAPDQNGSMVYVSKVADLPEAFRSTSDRVFQILNTPQGPVFLSDHWLFVRTANGALTAVRSDDHFMQAAWFQGALYVLDTGRGLTRFDGGALRSIAGGANMRGLTMLAAEAGLLIPSYNDGLVRYAPGSAKPWQVLNPTGWSPTDGADVTSSAVMNRNLLALGTAKHGVTLIDAGGEVLRHIDAAEGLADGHIYGLHYDGHGGLWLAVDNGVSLVSLNLPRDPAAAPFRAWVRSVVGTRDDRLLYGGAYFETVGGVQQLLQSKPQKLEFPNQYNAFRFAYSANGLGASGEMEFQTYMRGVDKDWSSWSTRTEREFTELRRGTWVFRVRARNANGEVSSEGTYELEVRPAWHDTWWFAAIQLIFVATLLILPGQARHKGLQDALTTFAVILPFSYVSAAMSDYIKHYSAGVGVFKILLSSTLAFLLDPIKKRLKKSVEKRNAKRAARRAAQGADKAAELKN